MRRMKRWFGSLLSIALIVSLVPASAFADVPADAPVTVSPSRDAGTHVRGMRPLEVLPLAADDEIPGTAMPGSPFSNSLSADGGDYVDVYSFSLAAGEVFAADLTMPAGRSFYMEVYDPTGTSIYEYQGLAGQSLPWDLTHDRIQVPAPNAVGGTYYLVVWLGDDNPYLGQYSINWFKTPRAGDDDVPGAIAPSGSPVSGALDWRTDCSDVYRFDLVGDQALTLTLTAGSGAASSAYELGGFDMYAYQAGTTSVWGDWPTWGVNTLDEGGSTVSRTYFCPPDGTGTVYVELHSELSAANYSLSYAITDPAVTRLSGETRYATSYEISKANYSTSGTAVIASGARFADALCASGLAGMMGAPLLLVPARVFEADGSLSQDGREFRNECMRLGVDTLLAVGGTAAISDAVLQDAADVCGATTTRRFAGVDRYATSAVVMDYMVNQLSAAPDVALVARGDKFADALSAAPFAYANAYPILLTRSDQLPDPVRAALQAATPGTAYVLGGTAAVNDTVFAALDGIVPAVERKAGADRYQTALGFASFVIDDLGAASWADVGLATGVNFPDALSGGAACGSRGGMLLLTEPTQLNAGVAAKLAEESAAINRVTIFGGTSAVSSAVQTAVGGALNP